MQIDPDNSKVPELYRLMIGMVVPRPIAWISSIDKEGRHNLAPFSFFNAFSVAPPILGVGIGARRGQDGAILKKDTLNNIEARGEFVVNIVSLPLAEKMNHTAGEFAPQTSEFDAAGLTAIEGTRVAAPRVEEAPVSMECVLHQIVPLGNSNLVLGKVVFIHIKDEILDDGRISIERLKPVGRLSGDSYCKVEAGTIFDLLRPEI
ncbi:MAG TPA: flavin reductase family protein [Candidatus Melainabacteria bacterium]|mgnify:CR=1 FL=1|nr:flavin reductase family protein [Candidatus Melainabacteria bacterium]HMP52227.1 flavin reductase family protein [Candidatus Melainabacteria bacterium]